jgi:hypothetical protein
MRMKGSQALSHLTQAMKTIDSISRASEGIYSCADTDSGVVSVFTQMQMLERDLVS